LDRGDKNMDSQSLNSLDSSSCYIGLRYLNQGQDILNKWFMLMGAFFLAPVILSFSYVLDMARNGGFFFLMAFALVFVYCAKENFVILYRIANESNILRKYHSKLRPNTQFNEDEDSILCSHIHNLNLIWKRSGKKHSRQDTLIEILHAKLKNEGSVVILASNIMITLGLIGTVSGLITSIGGLQVGDDVNGLMDGVSKAIDGMGVAFYTTLVGSMLGGITLRILHFYVDKQIDSFVFTMAEVVEIRIIPSLRLCERKTDVREIAIATVAALRDMNILKENENESQELRISA
jgi:biopolymer transport protein ExbB/TolQ